MDRHLDFGTRLFLGEGDGTICQINGAPSQSDEITEPRTGEITGQNQALPFRRSNTQEFPDLFWRENAFLNRDVAQVPDTGCRVAREKAFIDGRLERPGENLAHRDVDGPRRQTGGQQMVTIREKIVGRNGLKSDFGAST